MASIVYTLFSMAQVASLHCSARREISPCTCAPHDIMSDTIIVSCDGVGSFNQVVDALQNKISPDLNIWLKITHSQLEDLETRTFSDMNMKIKNLRLNNDQLRTLPESSFRNLSHMEYLSLSENNLEEIPRHILNHMPRIGTLDSARGKIKKISTDDFRSLKSLRHLILVSNQIGMLEKGSMPRTIRYLHLGRNNLTALNGTLRELADMELLFLNDNKLSTLDEELPAGSDKLMTIIAHHNKLQRVPQDLRTFPNLDSIYFSDNEIRSFDGVFKHSTRLHNIFAYNNKIEYLATDEFQDADQIESLDLASNFIRSLNSSLLPLRNMRICNISRNHLEEFSLDEIRGLKSLRVLDLSHNRIEALVGRMENIIELDLYVFELRLHHNSIKSLNGALMGLNQLVVLNLGHNSLKEISSQDLIGLDNLEILDVSHNKLQTLEETSLTFLPKLEKLDASFNNLSKLERDFHGLPVLCLADLSNNHISHISPDLVSKTRCSTHGVVSKLEVLLQENPILCNEDLPQLIGLMEVQETRLLGVAHCIVPKEQISVMSPTLVPPIPIIPADILPKAMLESPTTIVQVLMPAPDVIAPKALPMVASESVSTTPNLATTNADAILSSTFPTPTTSDNVGSIVSQAADEKTTVAATTTPMSIPMREPAATVIPIALPVPQLVSTIASASTETTNSAAPTIPSTEPSVPATTAQTVPVTPEIVILSDIISTLPLAVVETISIDDPVAPQHLSIVEDPPETLPDHFPIAA